MDTQFNLPYNSFPIKYITQYKYYTRYILPKADVLKQTIQIQKHTYILYSDGVFMYNWPPPHTIPTSQQQQIILTTQFSRSIVVWAIIIYLECFLIKIYLSAISNNISLSPLWYIPLSTILKLTH